MKNHIFFLNVLKRWSSQKKSRWKIIFLVLSGKVIFLFPKNMILFFRRKTKDDFFQKNTWKYNIFCKCSEKMVFPKKLHWNMIFFVFSGKMILLFPENMTLFFRRKTKDDLSRKNTWKYNIFCRCSEKMDFPKKFHRNMIFLVLSGKMIFIFPENMILLFRRKMKDHLSQKIHGNIICSVCSVKMVIFFIQI